VTDTSADTWLHPQSEGIPILRTSSLTQAFWDGCAEGELRFQRCDACGAAIFNPAPICRVCTSNDLRWEVSAGTGTVFSYTICHRPMTPQFTDIYAPVIVDLDEGYQMLSDLIGCVAADVHVGMRVQVRFHAVGDRTLPYFEPTPHH
jgi:uncharacterized OB-fold protein